MTVIYLIMTHMILKNVVKAGITMEYIHILSPGLEYFKMFLIQFGLFITIKSSHKPISSKIKILKRKLKSNNKYPIK